MWHEFQRNYIPHFLISCRLLPVATVPDNPSLGPSQNPTILPTIFWCTVHNFLRGLWWQSNKKFEMPLECETCRTKVHVPTAAATKCFRNSAVVAQLRTRVPQKGNRVTLPGGSLWGGWKSSTPCRNGNNCFWAQTLLGAEHMGTPFPRLFQALFFAAMLVPHACSVTTA